MPKDLLRVTPEQEATIRSLWSQGIRRDDVARTAGLTVDQFLAIKDRLELPPRPRSLGSGSRGVDPTQDEIHQACAEIRSRWTEADHLHRAGLVDPKTGEAHERGYRIIPISEIDWNG